MDKGNEVVYRVYNGSQVPTLTLTSRGQPGCVSTKSCHFYDGMMSTASLDTHEVRTECCYILKKSNDKKWYSRNQMENKWVAWERGYVYMS